MKEELSAGRSCGAARFGAVGSAALQGTGGKPSAYDLLCRSDGSTVPRDGERLPVGAGSGAVLPSAERTEHKIMRLSRAVLPLAGEQHLKGFSRSVARSLGNRRRIFVCGSLSAFGTVREEDAGPGRDAAAFICGGLFSRFPQGLEPFHPSAESCCFF